METANQITEDEYETLKKRIEIKKLENKLTDLNQERNIQQLKKNAETGEWEYTYVADQSAIDDTTEQLLEAKIDLDQSLDEIDIKNEEERLNRKSQYLADLKEIQDNALNGKYATEEEFKNAIQKLSNDLAIEDPELWAEMQDYESSGLVSFGSTLDESLTNMSNSYGSFVTSMTDYTTLLSESMASASASIEDAVKSMEDAVDRMTAAKDAAQDEGTVAEEVVAEETQEDRADQTFDEAVAESDANNADNAIPDVNPNKIWNIKYAEAHEQMPNVAITDEEGNIIPITVTRSNDRNFAVKANSPYSEGKLYTMTFDGQTQKFTSSANGAYKDGGETQLTGLHWLDGEIGKPERVLTSEQTASFNKLVEMLPSLPSIDVVKNWLPNIQLPDFSSMFSGSKDSKSEQHFHINEMVFPNVRDGEDVVNKLKDLSRVALLYTK